MTFRTTTLGTALAAISSILASCGLTDETITAENGLEYRVERVDTGDTKLPSNPEMKMVDNDLVRYALAPCELLDGMQQVTQRCDVFAQSDPSGALIGYVFLTQTGKGVTIDSDLEINPDKGYSTGCHIGGDLFEFTDDWKPVPAISEKFSGEFMYSAWEKEPGNWMVGAVARDGSDSGSEESYNPNEASGVWYVKKDGDKLRVNQERWNYCYRDVDVDEVFTRVLTLTEA